MSRRTVQFKGEVLVSVGDFTFSLLDLANSEEVCEYEKSLYRAFFRRGEVDNVRLYDHKLRRAWARISYDNQEIYFARLQKKIVLAVAFNFDMGKTLQLELRGFTIDKREPGVCEVLHLFHIGSSTYTSPLMEYFKTFSFDKVRSRGVEKIFITCLERRVHAYESLGFSVIDQNDIESNAGKTFLLQLSR